VEKLIIEAAVNEQSDKADNPHVPYSPEETAREALAAADAGAAIVHFHARHPKTGDLLHPGIPEYREIMHRIRAVNRDVLVYPTYGFSPTKEERFEHLEVLAADEEAQLDFATIDPGAVNFGKLDPETGCWVDDFVMSVSHAEARHFFGICARNGIRWSATVREPGQVAHTAAYHRQGWIRGPILFKLTFRDAAESFGLPPTPDSIRFLTSESLLGDIPCEWMTYSEGPSHHAMNVYAVENGGHVRTGLGDNVLYDGKLLSNAEQVERVVELARGVGREIATPGDVRSKFEPPVAS
jgi:uncharacterized protein (DUF849 family)